jgi:hypothetical protein
MIEKRREKKRRYLKRKGQILKKRTKKGRGR